MPDVAKNREIAVDPRLSASFAEGAKIMDVWEQHLSRSESSPVVGLLRQRVPGIRVCPETAARSSCLRTADAVHVTFSAPVLDDSTATVEATFITRTSDDSDSFDVQTWQYSFVMTPQGPASRGRELLARGHGRVGKN